jgi:hypothetical protein
VLNHNIILQVLGKILLGTLGRSYKILERSDKILSRSYEQDIIQMLGSVDNPSEHIQYLHNLRPIQEWLQKLQHQVLTGKFGNCEAEI